MKRYLIMHTDASQSKVSSIFQLIRKPQSKSAGTVGNLVFSLRENPSSCSLKASDRGLFSLYDKSTMCLSAVLAGSGQCVQISTSLIVENMQLRVMETCLCPARVSSFTAARSQHGLRLCHEPSSGLYRRWFRKKRQPCPTRTRGTVSGPQSINCSKPHASG